MKGDEERIRRKGCEAYLSKPISIGRLVSSIRDLIHCAPPPPAGDPAVTLMPLPSICLAESLTS